jgi:hypothetical protein
MRICKPAVFVIITASFVCPGHAENQKKAQAQVQQAPRQQQVQQLQQARYALQQRGGYRQPQSGHYATGQGRLATQSGRVTRSAHHQSAHYATQARSTRSSSHLASRTSSASRSRVASNRAGSRTSAASRRRVARVYNFHGSHIGGGKYEDGRLVGRFVNDRVFVYNHWYVWQEVPVDFDGVDGYGWAIADSDDGSDGDDGDGAGDDSSVVVGDAPDEAVEPVIIGSGPDYYEVEVNNVSTRISRAEFYQTYPRYTRVHHLNGAAHTYGRSSHAAQTRQSSKRKKN